MITSVQNKLVKELKKLHKRKYRYEANQYLIEGFHLMEEALKTNQSIEAVIVEEGTDIPDMIDKRSIITVSASVFKEISQTETPQGIAAVVNMRQVKNEPHNYVLLIDRIQDPGNLGTIIRTADAAGFSKIILGNGTVDMYNDKVIRASQGSIYHIPIVQENLTETIPHLQAEGFSIWGTTLNDAENYKDVQPNEKTAILLGNEGSGVDQSLIELVDRRVIIPIYGKAESLNVGIAAGILMYYIRN